MTTQTLQRTIAPPPPPRNPNHPIVDQESQRYLKCTTTTFYLDTAFVTMSGSWRVHCVMGDADCSCCVAIPMGEEGSILGAEVEVGRKSYSTKLVALDECGDEESVPIVKDGGTKARTREVGFNLLYETLVLTWSSKDFVFKYHVSTTNPFGSVILKSPPPQSIDQMDMFSLYLFAGSDKKRKVFRKEVVFVVDISESMQGNTIEVTKNALIAALSKLDLNDSYSIMAFNDQTHLYSSTLELATNVSLRKANEWIDTNFIASGDSIETRMQIWVSKASSTILTNIVIDGPDDLEIYPSTIPDLCNNRPLIISGRYNGDFPDKLEAKGILADMSNFSIEIEVQHTEDIPLEKVLARNQIESYTTQAWFSQDKKLEKVANISLETGAVSEYTHMIMLKTEPHYNTSGKTGKKQGKKKPDQEDLKTEKIYRLHHLGIGFGNMVATSENIPPHFGRAASKTDMLVRVACNCCADVFGKCCCMCCIRACSSLLE